MAHPHFGWLRLPLPVAVLVFVIAAGVHADPGWAVSCGDTLASGTRTVLQADLRCPGVSPVLRLEHGARLDMRGHTISCDGWGATAIWLDGSHAQLQDGTIADCGIAVAVRGTGGHAVRNVRATRPGPVEDTGTIGFDIYTINRNTVVDNEASGFEMGFFVFGSRNRVSRNAATSSRIPFLVLGDRNRLDANSASDSIDSGIIVEGERNRVLRNVGARNGLTGIAVGGRKNLVVDNEAYDNGEWGILIAPLPHSGGRAPSTGNVVVRNRASGNQQADLGDWHECIHNVWHGNVFGTSEAPRNVFDPECID